MFLKDNLESEERVEGFFLPVNSGILWEKERRRGKSKVVR
jgi:hypothetical protein